MKYLDSRVNLFRIVSGESFLTSPNGFADSQVLGSDGLVARLKNHERLFP